VEVFRPDRIILPVHLFALVSNDFHGRCRVDPCSFEIGYGIAFLYTGTLAECLGVALCVCCEPRLDTPHRRPSLSVTDLIRDG
jgi:hypothetical protein